MYALLILGVLSFVLCFLLTPLCRDLALRLSWVDKPDNVRKLHSRPVPPIGGVPIVLAYGAALAILLGAAPLKASIFVQHKQLLFSMLPAVTVVFLTGLIDDLLALKPWQKLCGQLIAAIIAVNAGARITLLDGHPYSELVTVPLSVLWLLACTNAFNLIDGLDGLASGIGLFATLTVLLAAILQGNLGLAMAIVPLVGCLLAFLRYNFNPASVFLGDSGSLTIGFLLGCFGVIWSQKSATFLGMLAPVMTLSLPLVDVCLSIVRRFLRNQPIFQSDSGHIHHRLLGFGFHPRTVAVILYGVCGIAAILSLLQSSFGHHVGGLIVIMFCFLAILGVKSLGYVEFKAAKRILTGTVLSMVRSEIHLAQLREKLLLAQTQEELWREVCDSCQVLMFSSVHLVLDGASHEEVFKTTTGPCWQLSISLGKKGSITVKQPMTQESTQSQITSFSRVLHECLETKTYMREVPAGGKAAHAAA